jgi:hypothetical protein
MGGLMDITQQPAAPIAQAAAALRPIEIEAKWERALRNGVIVFGRLALAFLFFTQLWWKLPPRFSCPPDFHIKQETAPGQYTKSSGLCTWLGYESIFANKPNREILVTELQYAGGPRLSVNIGPLARLNGWVVDTIIAPNIRVMGYVIWLAELSIVILLGLGLFTRLGGLIALGVSAQLMVGLANVTIPGDYEWEWAYNLMVVLSIMMIGLTPGRVLGLDALIRRWAVPAAAEGNALAKIVKVLT